MVPFGKGAVEFVLLNKGGFFRHLSCHSLWYNTLIGALV